MLRTPQEECERAGEYFATLWHVDGYDRVIVDYAGGDPELGEDYLTVLDAKMPEGQIAVDDLPTLLDAIVHAPESVMCFERTGTLGEACCRFEYVYEPPAPEHYNTLGSASHRGR